MNVLRKTRFPYKYEKYCFKISIIQQNKTIEL